MKKNSDGKRPEKPEIYEIKNTIKDSGVSRRAFVGLTLAGMSTIQHAKIEWRTRSIY